MPATHRGLLLSVAAAGLIAVAAAAASGGDAVPRSAQELLDCGFAKRFDRELAQIIDVETTRDGARGPADTDVKHTCGPSAALSAFPRLASHDCPLRIG